MNYEALEDEIVERLQPFAEAGVSVERLPETEAEKTELGTGEARMTVIYAGSEYEGTKSTAQVSQDEKIFIQILIESTFLRGPKGIYTLTEILKKALTDFRPQRISKLQVSKHHTIGQPDAEKRNNMWQYQVIFQGTSVHVEEYDQGDAWITLLKKITYSDGEDTTVVPPEES